MTLRSMMADKQLNFNQPLLSVRRGASIPAPMGNERKNNNSYPSLPPLPFYKSDLKSGPIRNPGVVPFKWEQMPGRPKGENNARNDTLECLTPVPKLPPGRNVNNMPKQIDDMLQESSTSSSRNRADDNISRSLETSLFDTVEESKDGNENKDACNSDDENLAYVNAREKVSRTESFFNCSVSGVSGLDGSDPSEAFSDPQTRDFMMGRFLPAAKAVASETPQFVSRRHPVAREQEQPVMKTVTLKKQSPRYESVPDPLCCTNGEENNEEEEESDRAEDLSVKLCGLMPRFCMLNPIPGMRDHVEVISSARSARTRPAYAAAGRDHKHKDAGIAYRGELKRTAIRFAPTNESTMTSHSDRNGIVKEPRDISRCKPNLPKKGYTTTNLASHDSTEEISSSVNRLADEKTLYVDSESMVESRHSNSSSLESKGRNPSMDSLQDIKSFRGVSKGIKNLRKGDKDVTSIVDAKQPPKASSPLGLTSLLPKSPSESWLSRTLPSMPSRNPSSKSYLVNHAFRHSPVNPKSSGAQNMLFLSAGVLAPISEN